LSWINKTLQFYGFREPFNIPAALLFLSNFVLLIIVVVTGLSWFMKGQLVFDTPRFFFILYLTVTLFAAAVLSRAYRLSLFLLCLCFVDFGLGTFSSVTNRLGLGANLLPDNYVKERRFDYHPLLQGVPKPNFIGNEGVLIKDESVLVKHNADGMRGSEIGNINSGIKLIFAFGGSTTYDMGVDQGKTWVEQLQNNLGATYLVLNFGVPGYSTQEHVTQTAFYGDYKGVRPACAVYYIGWNDIRNAHIPDLDRGYAGFHSLSQLGNLKIRDSRVDFAKFSPLLYMAVQYSQSQTDVVPFPPDFSDLAPQMKSDPALEAI